MLPDSVASFGHAKQLLFPLVANLTQTAARSVWCRVRRAIEQDGVVDYDALAQLVRESVATVRETGAIAGLPGRIDDADHAVAVLSTVVRNMAATAGPNNADDAEQAIWLSIVADLAAGRHDTGLLLSRAGYARDDEWRMLASAGLRPARSKYPPPQRQLIPSLGLNDDDDDEGVHSPWREPSYETTDDAGVLLAHLLSLCVTDDQRAVVAAGARLKAMSDDDADSVRLGQLGPLVDETGLSARKVRAAQAQLADIYAQETGLTKSA